MEIFSISTRAVLHGAWVVSKWSSKRLTRTEKNHETKWVELWKGIFLLKGMRDWLYNCRQLLKTEWIPKSYLLEPSSFSNRRNILKLKKRENISKKSRNTWSSRGDLRKPTLGSWKVKFLKKLWFRSGGEVTR